MDAIECKLDRLSRLQDGCWSLTLKVHPDEMPQEIAFAPMGQRFGLAFAKIPDNPNNEGVVFKDGYTDGSGPPKRQLTPGEKAKRHFEASVADDDGEFANWFRHELNMGATDTRESVKAFLGIESANDIVEDPSR